MKYPYHHGGLLRGVSHPTRSAWIEITMSPPRAHKAAASHPTRGAWIEIKAVKGATLMSQSHPTRGAWIEIPLVVCIRQRPPVAPHTGCVD